MANARRAHKPRFVGQDQTDPNGFAALVRCHIEDLRSLGYAESGLPDRLRILEHLSIWSVERGIQQPRDLTKPMLEQYRRYLSRTPAGHGALLSFNSQAQRLTMIRQFFRWLVRHNYIPGNPASDLECPRVPQRLPRYVLDQQQVETILQQPDIDTVLGLRDRAMMELLYATGIRRQEASNLDLTDLHTGRGLILIREGKQGKDRYAPLGERLEAWLTAYLDRSRPELMTGTETQALWLSNTGVRLQGEGLSALVRAYKRQAGIDVPGAAHLFRHAMATLMLEGGADIRYVQTILGHKKLETTEIYTHVSLNQLKLVYAATHPAAQLKRSREIDADVPDIDGLFED